MLHTQASPCSRCQALSRSSKWAQRRHPSPALLPGPQQQRRITFHSSASRSSRMTKATHVQATKGPCPSASNQQQQSPAAATAPAAAAVLVRNGCPVSPAPASPQTLLSEHPGGSYTTALVVDGWLLLDWELHLARLARNVRVLAEQQPPTYAAFTAWLQDQQQQQQQQQQGDSGAAAAAAEQVLDALVSPQVALALQLLEVQQQQQQQQEAAGQRAMLTVLVTDPPQATAAAGHDDDGGDACGGGQLPLSVYVWAKPLPASPATAAKVLVAGDPRPFAQAKHCSWVLQRQPLEALKQQQGVFDEVVLSNFTTGELLEGLVTNFYVIADEAVLSSSASSSSDEKPLAGADAAVDGVDDNNAAAAVSGLVLMTTGGSDAALLGVTQQRVLQACAAVGLRVLLQAPKWQQSAAWREAFLTNCVKGIQPVTSIQLSTDVGSPVWCSSGSSSNSGGVGRVTALLQAALQQLQATGATDMRRFLPADEL